VRTPTHASFFSGVGGLDLGLERSGWRTVSFSEIDPYACAVLRERWPGIHNLGSITDLDPAGVPVATLWTGGFPCQDLSVAGKRAGFTDGKRSVLAFAFLDLVAVHRPEAILLENVPGLLSSNGGADFLALLAQMAELGYGVAYRTLDARHFGVPQRRRRVFILGLRSDPDDVDGHLAALRAAAVLAVGTRCERHPATGQPKGAGAAAKPRNGVDIARAVTGTSGKHHDEDTDTLIPEFVGALNNLGHHGWTANAQSVAQGHVIAQRSPADARGDGAADGLAGRLDPGAGVGVFALRGREEGNVPEVSGDGMVPSLRGPGGGSSHAHVFVKRGRAQSAEAAESWGEGDVMPTLNAFDTGDSRTTAAVLAPTVNSNKTGGWRFDADQAESLQVVSGAEADDPLLPVGLDSNRYRCCGNGVVAPVAEWLGRRILAALA
jgi:site-specific DNA-cytosine methylase